MSSAAMPSRRPGETMLRQAGFGVALIALLSGGVNLLILVSPIYMFQVFDRVLLTFRVETLIYLSVVAGLCILVLGVFDGLRGVAVARLGRWWDDTARPDLLDASLAAARTRGPNLGATMQDLNTVRGFVGGSSLLPFFDAPWAPLFIAVIFLLHPILGFIALGSAIVLLCFAVANDVFSRMARANTSGDQMANGVFAATALRNADVVHAMGMQPAVVALHDRRQNEINAAGQVGAERTAVITGVSKAVRIGVQVAILGVGAYLVTLGQLTAGGMIAASIILGRALAPVEQGIGAWRGFTSAREAHGRITELLAAMPATSEPTALPAPIGKLSVENLSLRIPGQDKPVLRSVSFALQPGSVMAVVGPSAAGKSSLCRLLVGSWRPATGHVRLDGADLSQWRSEDRCRYIGYLPQSIELFGGTVRDNIARLGKADDAAVIEAATRAGCHEMILRLPRGYDTDIGEGGAFLSGGQRQRIGLARALFGEPRLVVLDEPNSNLDQEGESALIAAIAEIKRQGATVVLVSHRFAMMRVVDMIGVLQAGVMEKFGPRDLMLQELQAVPQAPTRKVAAMSDAKAGEGA
jgi:ATP-binding cassette, subfamily C, bacterial exporter for protease/lipase